MSDEPVTSPEQTLAWESRWGTGAAASAIVAGVATLGSTVATQAALSDAPRVSVVRAVREGLAAGAAGQPVPGLKAPLAQFYDDKAGDLLVGAAIASLGSLAAGLALLYLYRATVARRPEVPRAAIALTVFGALVSAIMGVLVWVLRIGEVDDIVGRASITDEQFSDAIRDVSPVAQGLAIAGQLALAFAFVLISLNAMRSGLLTRFMGTLGIIVGVLFVIPLTGPPIVQGFWLIALGFLFLRRWAGGIPPAWETGQAEPWPTAAELRAQREDAQKASKPAVLDGEAEEPELPGAAHSSSKKRKRKRRR